MATTDGFAEKYVEFSLTDATTQAQLAAKIAEMTFVLNNNSVTPSLSCFATGTVLSTAQAGDGDSTNTFDFGNDNRNNVREAALVRVTSTAGSTPTCTYAIMGSTDGVTFTALEIADSATPATFGTSTWVETTNVTRVKLVKAGQIWRYLKVVYSLNTNVTNDADVYPLGD